jgi:hypothetical protein
VKKRREDMTKAELLESMRRRLRRIIREVGEGVALAEWLAINRTDIEPPIDCEGDRLVLAKATECLAALERGDHDEHTRLSKQLVALAETNAKESC